MHATVGCSLYEKNLTIHSYDDERRYQMLLSWAKTLKCKWLEHDELRRLIIKSLEEETKLPTPLNIKDFIVATIDVTNEEELLDILDSKSKETANNFAQEVKQLTFDRILFLSFPFISDNFSLNFVKVTYYDLIKESELNIDNWEFDRILRQFRGSKIDISGDKVRFPIHHILKHYLFCSQKMEFLSSAPINTKIFSKVLVKLAGDDNAEYYVFNLVEHNLELFSQDVKYYYQRYY
jgi:hypothetical protein